jgi:hypothetical protein
VSDVSETGKKVCCATYRSWYPSAKKKRGEESASSSSQTSSLTLSRLGRLTSVDLKLARVGGSLQCGEMDQLANGSRLVLPIGVERLEDSARRA